MAETLAGARLHSLVGELSICAEAVHLSSPALSVDVLSCLEAPLRGLSALVAIPSDAPHAPTRVEDRPLPPDAPTGAPPIWPNTSSSNARRLLQQNSCGAGEVRYETACGIGSCNSGDREIGVTCDGCGFTCSTTLRTFTKEICCRKPTPSPTRAPNNSPTSAPISAPPSAPPASKSSNCGLPSPQETFPTMKNVTDALHARTVAGDNAPLSLKVTLGSDETLQALVNVSANVSVEIDGAGRTITLLDFGFNVDNGRLCLHDVELTGGRNIPALVVLGQAAEVNASHVRISNCGIYADVQEAYRSFVSALDACTVLQPALANIPNWLLPTVCNLFPDFLQQCCDPTKKPPSRLDVRLAMNLGAGTACASLRLARLVLLRPPVRVGAIGSLSSGCRLLGRVQLCCWTRASYSWCSVTSTEMF
jgi:hypothetical protein